ncbi:MAG: aldehyde dehydrogenase family protein [Thermofilum sp.]
MLLINDYWINETHRGVLRVQDLAVEGFFAETPRALAREVSLACQAALNAVKGWSCRLSTEQTKIVIKNAKGLEKKMEGIAKVFTCEQEEPFKEAKEEVRAASQTLRFFARYVDFSIREWHAFNRPGMLNLVQHYLIGPIVVILPCNYSVLPTAWRAASALVASCTVVIKLFSKTPLAVAEFERCLIEAGSPEWKVNLVHRSGRDISIALVRSPAGVMIVFTGETEAGKTLVREAPQRAECLVFNLGVQCP